MTFNNRQWASDVSATYATRVHTALHQHVSSPMSTGLSDPLSTGSTTGYDPNAAAATVGTGTYTANHGHAGTVCLLVVLSILVKMHAALCWQCLHLCMCAVCLYILLSCILSCIVCCIDCVCLI
jgi:hypothetical protein